MPRPFGADLIAILVNAAISKITPEFFPLTILDVRLSRLTFDAHLLLLLSTLSYCL